MPVSSKLWFIKAASLKHLGGLASVSRKIVPEESFAYRLFAQHAYRFLVSNKSLGVTTAKRWSSQIQTSLRLSYPLLRRQPLTTLVACSLLVGLFFAPLAVAVSEIVRGHMGVVAWLSIITSALLLVDYFLVLARTQPRTWFVAGLLWPYVILQEVFLGAASMVLYEFAEVNWKGRNVCYPVLLPQPVRADEPGVWRRLDRSA
jgi:hypothetical protein